MHCHCNQLKFGAQSVAFIGENSKKTALFIDVRLMYVGERFFALTV
jgi:hypothetical protein